MEYFNKALISEKLMLIPPNLTKEKFLQYFSEILNEFGISLNNFPYSMKEFLKVEYHQYLANRNLNFLAIDHLLDLILTTVLCKRKILQYFEFINNQVRNFDQSLFFSNVSAYANELLCHIGYFSLEESKMIESTHWKLIYEDNFAILAAYQTLRKYPKVIENLKTEDITSYINYLEVLIENYEKLFDISLEPERKVLLRSYFLNDLRKSEIDQLQLIILIDNLNNCPPSRMPPSDLELFRNVSNSIVIDQAVESFVNDTLSKKNPPFMNRDEGIQMIKNAFKWVYSSGKVFYFMIQRAHGFSNQGFVFVHKIYQVKSPEGIAFRLLTLLHETFHIYKRFISNNSSPENSFIVLGEKEVKAEDGLRFNNILFPIYESEMYFSTAKFFGQESNWNTSLNEFQEKLLMHQNQGNLKGEEYFKFWSSVSPMSMPYSCVRMQFRKNLSSDSSLYWI